MKMNGFLVFPHLRRQLALVPMLALSWLLPLQGQNSQTWISTNANNDWSLSAPNWDAGVVWTNGNHAIFAGTGETVELASDITVTNITFNSNGYVIADANNDSALTLAGPSTITVTNASHTATINEAITNGSLIKAGAGILVLNGANLFSGTVGVTGGRLSLGSNTALGTTGSGTSVSGTGQIELQDGVTITGEALSLGSGGSDFFGGLRAATDSTATWAGNITLESSGRLGGLSGSVLNVTGSIQNGSATNLIISATGSGSALGTVVLNGGNSYTGATTVFRGRLRLGTNDALPTTTTLDLDSTSAAEDSVLDLNGFNQTIATLQRSGSGSGAGGSFITNDGATTSTLTVNQTGTTTYSGSLQDGVGVLNFTKANTGTLTLSGINSHSGTTSVTGGTLILTGNNSMAGQMNVTNGAVLEVGHNNALGSTAGGTVVSGGGRVVLQNGITVTGETITISGTGGNNFGALQTATSATAEWAGDIISNSPDARIGGGASGTLIVSGVISGSNASYGILFSRGNDATTILNNVNTYTGDTQLFANGGTGATLRMGVDNAINSASRLSVIATVASVSMKIDLNGHILNLRGLDTQANHTSGAVLAIQNDAATPSTLTVSGTTGTHIFAGSIKDSTGGVSFVKEGASTQTFIAAQTYTGSTTINGGTIQLGAAVSTLGVNGRLASTNIILNNGGTLVLDNLGASNNGTDRIADNAVLSFRGGSLIYRGSDLANSTETVGDLVLTSKRSTLTASFGGTGMATLTGAQLVRSANGGIALVNGVNLGKDNGSTSVARILFNSTPTLVGSTAALTSGINASAKNTQIVPYLLGESTLTTGGTGTQSGTINTFLTYNATTGLRPLNLTDEFTWNSFVSGHNTYIETATSLSSSTAVNSLILNGVSVTVGNGNTLTVDSGAILFSGGSNLTLGNGGSLAFGNREGIITINSTGNTFITSVITGTGGVSYYGTGTMVTNQQHTYTGDTALYVGTVIPQNSSLGSAGSPTSGPFGRGTLILAGAAMRASTSSNITIHNNVSFLADTTIIDGSVNRSLTFAGDVTLTDGNRLLTHQSSTNTVFSGAIGDGGQNLGLTVAGSGSGSVILSGNNTYTGPTSLTGNTTLLINGNQSAATGGVTVSAGILGGTGTIGGATVIASGGTLSPGDPTSSGGLATLNLAQGLTLKASSVTRLEISGATFTSLDSFGGNAPGSSEYMNYVLSHASGSGSHDRLNITGTLNQETGGKIQVLSASFTPQEGQIFNLIDWSAISGNSFSSNLGNNYRDGASDSGFDLDLPDISGSGLFWDTSFFTSHGVLVVVAVVPEPGRGLFILLSLALVRLRRRRR